MPPEDLPESAHEQWHRVCGYLHGEGFDLQVAYPQLYNYCFQYHIYVVNSAQVSKSDTPGVEVFSNGNRGVCKNYAAMSEARKQMDAFEKNWGFTPWSVAKITRPQRVSDEEGEDEWEL